MARHAIDFWLTTGTCRPSNRVTVDRDGHVHVAKTYHNLEPHQRLLGKLKELLGPLGCHDSAIPSSSILDQRIPLAGNAHQCGTVRFGTDPEFQASGRTRMSTAERIASSIGKGLVAGFAARHRLGDRPRTARRRRTAAGEGDRRTRRRDLGQRPAHPARARDRTADRLLATAGDRDRRPPSHRVRNRDRRHLHTDQHTQRAAALRFLRPTALVLAGDMVGAIVVSGLARGEIISLTLAPALLVAMIFQLRAEPGTAGLSEPPGLRSRGAGAPAPRARGRALGRSWPGRRRRSARSSRRARTRAAR